MRAGVCVAAMAALTSAACFADPALPSIVIAGSGAVDWARPLVPFFDSTKVTIVNHARRGALIGEGHSDRLLAGVKDGDYVLIQLASPSARLEDETRNVVRETKSRSATPILLAINRELAKSEGIAFIDLASLVAGSHEPHAKRVVAGLKALRQNALIRWLSPAGRAIENAVPDAVLVSNLPLPPPGRSDAVWFRWLNLPEVADATLPSLFLIGDSTVRNGRGDAIDGQWGWGDPLAAYFDPARINVVNRAVGGTGSRSFLGRYWNLTLAMVKPGDVVIMQFGHNDNGRGGPLPGVGEETEQRENAATKQTETIHTYGWYLRRYIADTRAKGATPIVCSLVPRNIWEGGKIARPRDSHADWVRDVAKTEGVGFLDLHEIIARRYDPMGEEAVTALFADKRVHTTRAGAEMSAACVIAGLQGLPLNPVARFLRPKPAAVW